MKYFVIALVVIICVPLCILLAASDTPKLQVDSNVTAIGIATPVKVHVEDPHGIRKMAAWVEQNGSRYPVYDSSWPSTHVLFFGKNAAPRDVVFNAGTKNAPALKDGPAKLVVEANSNDFRGASASDSRDVTVVTRPPSITADGAQHYINQGGCELVTFTVQGFATATGERSGHYTFRSWPLPGKQGQSFSLFAYPWDVPPSTVPVVFATNPAGNEAVGHFWYKIFPKKFRKRDLAIDDAFLEKVDNEIDPNGSGDLLQRFLKINGEMRRENNQTLSDLRAKTADHFLWTGPFLQLANSKVESEFADDRSYIYKGKKVDEQVHLGFDLSKVKNTPILASNDGRVVFAQRLGIYGNCIVVDHGYGLQSIYGHLSRIDVKPGDMVKRGQAMGLSGATGLAGGDHLHFSMQLDGVQINPVEWWDEHWIRDRIVSKL